MQYITNITKDFGIGIIPLIENGGETREDALGFHMEYGERDYCDFFDTEHEGRACSDDGILWQADDMGAPYFCTNHYFPQEQLGYEFIELGDY